MVRILILLFILTVQIIAQNFSATARTDSVRYLVGDYITYKIKLTHPANYKYKLWEIQKGLGGLELISAGQPVLKAENGVHSVELSYTLSGYDSGYKTISGGDVLFINNTMSDTQRVFVDSSVVFINTVSVDTASEIKDIDAPKRIPMSTAEILMWIGIVLLAAGIVFLIYWYIKRRKPKEEKPVIPEIPVDDRVMQKLDDLENKKLWQNGLIKEYHTEITEIIRGYFEEKLSIPALEMTTSEIYSALSKGLRNQQIAATAELFLNNADLVKFAKFVPLAGINEEMMQQARKMVDLCKAEKPAPDKMMEDSNV